MATLTAKQERAIVALLTEPTVTAAAAAARVGERTLHSWLKEPDFDAAYRAARREAARQAIGRLQAVSADAVNVLAAVMCDRAAPVSVRVQAAVKVLELSLKSCELEDLDTRLARLEIVWKEEA